jgi:hypothetical protein
MSITPPAADWWQATDGRWYPPELLPSYVPPPPSPPSPGWWQASDGQWYPPEQHPNFRPPPPTATQTPAIDFERKVSRIEVEKWSPKGVVLRSDGSPRALLDAIAVAIETAQYPVTERSYADLRLVFESRGMSWKSWSGDVTTVLVSPIEGGSRASFISKGKPSGPYRVQARSNAITWVSRLKPGFGELWLGRR